jgi:hypothetical protein
MEIFIRSWGEIDCLYIHVYQKQPGCPKMVIEIDLPLPSGAISIK